MRHKLNSTKAATGPLPPVNKESRSSSTMERSSTFDFRENLALLEEDWSNSSQQTGTASSFSSSILLDMCRCCGRADCENLEYYTRTIKKLESDTRLAAEIGQGLLHKHETYVAESNQQKAQLEKQLDEWHEKINGLEQSLDEVENVKDGLLKEKNKWLWEYQKRQKILDETISDLEMANEKCRQLSIELESRSTELEKLRLFKFMVRHSQSREEALTSKLEDTEQELVICRKNELVLESHIKKLKVRYESLYHSHEQLTRNIEDTALLVNSNSSRTNATKPVSSNNPKNNSNNNDLINLIKELSSANAKLKSDLMNCKDQLLEARGEVTALTQKMDDKTDNTSLYNEMKQKPKKKRATSVNEHPKKSVPIKSKTIQPPMPTISCSMPTSSLATSPGSNAVVHHHYHYYVKNSKGEQIPITDAIDMDDCTLEKHPIGEETQPSSEDDDEILVLSPSTSSIITIKDGTVTTATTAGLTKSPFLLLQEHVTQVLDRLRGSDIRALNRRLKRAFDITELSSMSNSIIENILMDVDNLENRFLWVKTTSQSEQDFFPIVDLFKTMLKELGVLKSTMNELQTEYVKKIEANEQRVEEEIIKKRLLKRQHQQSNQTVSTSKSTNTATTNTTPLTWFTNIFSNKETTPTPVISTSIEPSDVTTTTSHNIHHCDKGSTLTKTTTNSSTLILSNDEDDHSTLRNRVILEEEPTTASSNNSHHPSHYHYARTFPRQSMDKRRQIPYFPSTSTANQPLILTSSQSTGTNRSPPSIPIRNNNAKRNLHHRMNIDYEGIGPATIRPILSDRDNTTTFSSSWLGGK